MQPRVAPADVAALRQRFGADHAAQLLADLRSGPGPTRVAALRILDESGPGGGALAARLGQVSPSAVTKWRSRGWQWVGEEEGRRRSAAVTRALVRRVSREQQALLDLARLQGLVGAPAARELALILGAPPCQARLDAARRVCEAVGEGGLGLIARLAGVSRSAASQWRRMGWRYQSTEAYAAQQQAKARKPRRRARAPPGKRRTQSTTPAQRGARP